jgi:uncharacterized iron-regulated membrane protein
VDPATLRVTDVTRFADFPLMAKLSRWGVDVHMGTLFGLANQIVLAALALGLAAMIVFGYLMWWQRRPTRGARRAVVGPPPARGARQQLPAWVIAVGVPVVFVLGWALPLFGVPLALFLLIDVLVGTYRKHRDRPIAVSPVPQRN